MTKNNIEKKILAALVMGLFTLSLVAGAVLARGGDESSGPGSGRGSSSDDDGIFDDDRREDRRDDRREDRRDDRRDDDLDDLFDDDLFDLGRREDRRDDGIFDNEIKIEDGVALINGFPVGAFGPAEVDVAAIEAAAAEIIAAGAINIVTAANIANPGGALGILENARLDVDNGILVENFRFVSPDGVRTDVRIDALTGAVLRSRMSVDNSGPGNAADRLGVLGVSNSGPGNANDLLRIDNSGSGSGARLANRVLDEGRFIVGTQGHSLISPDEAKLIALDIASGDVRKITQSVEKGRPVFKIELKTADGGRADIRIDAETKQIVSAKIQKFDDLTFMEKVRAFFRMD